MFIPLLQRSYILKYFIESANPYRAEPLTFHHALYYCADVFLQRNDITVINGLLQLAYLLMGRLSRRKVLEVKDFQVGYRPFAFIEEFKHVLGR